MFEDDDFFINDDELAEDNQLTIVDFAKLDLLNSLIKAANDMITNIKFNEQTEANTNTEIISSYVDSLISLRRIDTDGLSDEEVFEEIENILKKTTELTFSNMNDILPDDPEETTITEDETDTNSDGTDW